ncbi:MAG: nuclear transport factor 2 family protein [Marmoricola sp.]
MEHEAQIIDALYDAYNRHDADGVAALYGKEGEHEDVAFGRPKRGPEAIAGGLRYFLTAFPDAHWETSDRLTEKGRAVARYVLTGTLRADMGPFKAAGQRLEIRGVQVLEVAAGHIERSEDFWDGATFERQMQNNNDGESQHRGETG